MNKIAKIAIHKEAGLNIRNTEGIEFKGKWMLDYLPEHELEIVLLQKLFWNVCQTIKRNQLTMFLYYRHSRICYIWPATIPWDKMSKSVAGFCKGDSFWMKPLKLQNSVIIQLMKLILLY
jgi:hypothetical protein